MQGTREMAMYLTLSENEGSVKHTFSVWNRRWGEAYNEWGGSVLRRRKRLRRLGPLTWHSWQAEGPTVPISVTYANADGSTTGPLPLDPAGPGYAENRLSEYLIGSRFDPTVVSDIVGVRVDFVFNGKKYSISDGRDWLGRYGWDALAFLGFVLVVAAVAIVIG